MKSQRGTGATPSSISGSVCVIDGDEGIRNSLCTLLGTLGIRAVPFGSAEEFLEDTAAEQTQFLILELALPGISGFELKEQLDQKGLMIPCIGLTGESNPRMTREASRLGFLDLVEKPFVSWQVVDRIQEFLPAIRSGPEHKQARLSI